MNLINTFFIAVGLAMDAFSVAVSAGICIPKPTAGHYLRLSAAFGLFQFGMPLAGYFLGQKVEPFIRNFDHWVAMGILMAIGAKMIHEYFERVRTDCDYVDPTCGRRLIFLSVATSIDALAVGVSYGVLGKAILVPSIIIGIVAAGFTAAGIVVGRKAGVLIGKKAELLGGIVLIGIGIKIALEHTVFA